MLYFLSGFFGGVFASSFVSLGFESAWLVLALASAFFVFGLQQEAEKRFFLSFSIFFLAAGLGIFRYGLYDSRAVFAPLYEKEGELVSFPGTIISDPVRAERFTRSVFRAEGANILLTLPHYPETFYGDRLTISGILKRPKNFSEERGFDWPAYLAKDNIYFEMFLPEVRTRESGGGFFVKRALFQFKHAYLDNLSRVLTYPESALAAGITVGERNSLGEELEEAFRRAGLIHIIVLSGYNLTLVATAVGALLAAFSVPRMVSVGAASLSILLFAILAGGSGAVMRAALMGILVYFARSYGKVYEAKNALVAAAFVMTLVNPKSLRFDVSFQLSFLATLSLLVFLPKIEVYFRRLPKTLGIKESFLATLSTQTFVTPLLLMQSGAVSLLSLLANVLVLMATPLAMFLGFFAGLAGFFSEILSQIIAWPLHLLLAYQIYLAKFFAAIDIGRLPVSSIGSSTALFLYLLLAVLVITLPEYHEKKA